MTKELEKQNSNLTLVEKLRLKRSSSVLLLDVSGSMGSDLEPGKTKISALRDTVSNIQYNPKVFWFSSGFGECTKDEIPDSNGMTNLSRLLTHIKFLGHKSCIVLTDGDITDQEETLIAKEDLSIKVMYIGSGPKPAFLDKLATSGFATTEDLNETKQLTEKLTLLLAPPDQKKGAIEL